MSEWGWALFGVAMLALGWWLGRATVRTPAPQADPEPVAPGLAVCPRCDSPRIVVESASCQVCGMDWQYDESPGRCPFCGASEYLFDPAYCPDCGADWRPDTPRQFCVWCSGHGVNYAGYRCEYCGGTGYRRVEPERSEATWS